jgi:hypothetical protein
MGHMLHMVLSCLDDLRDCQPCAIEGPGSNLGLAILGEGVLGEGVHFWEGQIQPWTVVHVIPLTIVVTQPVWLFPAQKEIRSTDVQLCVCTGFPLSFGCC